MKKILTLITISLATLSFGQVDYNQWSVGLNIGVHDGMAPTAAYTRVYQPNHFSINGRYMINNRIGLRASLNYDLFKFKSTGNSGGLNTNYWRTTVEGVVNAGDLLRFDTWTKKVGLLVHGGAGMSHMYQGDSLRGTREANDPLFKETDDMLNFTFGATPQFKINEQISLNADLTFIFHHNQTQQFDMQYPSKHGAIDGYFVNLSVGASYYFGDKSRHADWTPTVYGGGGDVDMTKYETIMNELNEKTKDDDKDGVPNYVDAEPNTPEGSYVDSKGVAMKDSDNDGILDAYDACPNEKGLFSNDGCPDSDGDGIGDNKDKCPTVAGIWNNSGCPEVSEEVKEVMDKALKGVEFETGKDVLLPQSYKSLDEVVRVMMTHQEYKLSIEGHTDNVGTPEDNMKLSMDRATACADYLIAKGIAEDRLVVQAYGETRPKALNDTEAGRKINRRVEFNIVF